MKKWRVQGIMSYIEFTDVEAETAEEAEEIAKSDNIKWTKLEPGDWKIDDVSPLE